MRIPNTLLLLALSARFALPQPDDEARRRQQEMTRRTIEQLTPEERAHIQANGKIKRADWIAEHPARESTGLVALPDLGKGTYKGEQGGLYPGGVNTIPAAHLKTGLEQARRIVPLDAEGRESAGGKIVLISVGMSNTTMKFQVFQKLAKADLSLNPNLVIVDGAQGGQVVWVTAKPNAIYWDVVDERLKAAGVTRKQVQAAWVLQAIPGPREPWPAEVKSLQHYLVETLHVMRDRFPNLRIAYLSSRTYAGYATSPLNPEPHSYESGFAYKWLIADQIAGKPELSPARAPWCAWGPYVWADGTRANQDGLSYARADYVDSDGTHPSESGRMKVAQRLLQFLKTDPTARPWFLGSSAGAGYFPPPDSQGGWRSLTGESDDKIREAAGIDRQKLDEAFRYAQETSQHGGLLVVRHGWLVYEKYYGRGNREANPQMASCGKAFTSIACGIMLKEKRDQIPEGLDQKVFTAKYLPEAFPLSDPGKADIKLGHLLTMTSGMREGNNAGYVRGEQVKPPPAASVRKADIDAAALHTPQWCKPGDGYSYSTASTHVASIVLRHLVGMELQQYIDERLAQPMQFGRWGYARQMEGAKLSHTPGGFGIALRSTDALRFAYLLLHHGQWNGRELVPADYIALCARMSPYNPHFPFSLQFEVNEDGHVAGAPRDAFWKSGAGGFGIYVVPSLDLVIYKMAGTEAQYDPKVTELPELYKYDGSRDKWKSPGINVDDGVRKVVAMVSAAVIQ